MCRLIWETPNTHGHGLQILDHLHPARLRGQPRDVGRAVVVHVPHHGGDGVLRAAGRGVRDVRAVNQRGDLHQGPVAGRAATPRLVGVRRASRALSFPANSRLTTAA